MTQLPSAIANQSRPDPSVHAGTGGTYEQAIRSYSSQTGEVKGEALPVVYSFDVTPDQVAASIMRFLEGVADDEGGNAARYFPAIMVSRMSRRIADDINNSAVLPEIAQ